ncbi:type II toxin-antitoxin system RelE/ParE family toxin [Methanospirillum hungatei]|uniref:type II toxin-antitoxin system RelE family toxin n=1 Tax=Methanospirillum hungatei TaxID=2203 RepID=UPI002A1D355F|nr:type II toxin-antitoxin system RelE/ParE family toxin [Methanospirillum hungatei]
MAHTIIFTKEADNRIRKTCKRDHGLCEEVKKKLRQIDDNPFIGKPLRNVLKGTRRVHVGSFVLLYQYEEDSKCLKIISFSHHDEAYSKTCQS